MEQNTKHNVTLCVQNNVKGMLMEKLKCYKLLLLEESEIESNQRDFQLSMQRQ